MDVILWFDTEDYLLPADDDATRRVCDMLTRRGIRATFKIVGEKARVLERRGRRDVIAALRRHDIGYHSNLHSVHPTPTEYLADCDWLAGVDEFARREGGGAADVRRILGVRTLACYGQPGSSWGPQAIAALGRIGVAPHGVPCYVDEGTHVGIDGQPFWYAGALNVYHMAPNYTRMDLHEPGALEPACRQVDAIAARLRTQGGGLISIFYHPCEWVHREFWDAVNFARGANPSREAWKAPSQRTPAETEAAFVRFGDYVDHIRAIPGVRWITASDLPLRYPDRSHTDGLSEQGLSEVARRIQAHVGTGLDYERIGNAWFSVADQFELLALALDGLAEGSPLRFPVRATGVMGPDSRSPASASPGTLPPSAFWDAVRDAAGFVRVEHRVPSRVFVGAEGVAPADFLAAMAAAWLEIKREGGRGGLVRVSLPREVRILAEDRIARDTPELFGGWVIHKPGFRAPRLMELARLQSWSLKPALREQH